MCLEQNLVEDFNPSLQKLVSLGNSYIQAFRGKSSSGKRQQDRSFSSI